MTIRSAAASAVEGSSTCETNSLDPRTSPPTIRSQGLSNLPWILAAPHPGPSRFSLAESQSLHPDQDQIQGTGDLDHALSLLDEQGAEAALEEVAAVDHEIPASPGYHAEPSHHGRRIVEWSSKV